jgi:hypothetical protein
VILSVFPFPRNEIRLPPSSAVVIVRDLRRSSEIERQLPPIIPGRMHRSSRAQPLPRSHFLEPRRVQFSPFATIYNATPSHIFSTPRTASDFPANAGKSQIRQPRRFETKYNLQFCENPKAIARKWISVCLIILFALVPLRECGLGSGAVDEIPKDFQTGHLEAPTMQTFILSGLFGFFAAGFVVVNS